MTTVTTSHKVILLQGTSTGTEPLVSRYPPITAGRFHAMGGPAGLGISIPNSATQLAAKWHYHFECGNNTIQFPINGAAIGAMLP